jgi:hypothetical protein
MSYGEGDIAVLGGGILVDELLLLDLIDEPRLFIHTRRRLASCCSASCRTSPARDHRVGHDEP